MMQSKQRVVIAGGGTAGWMAAAALTRLLRGQVDVTLIESSEIGTVGVGEATIPTLAYFHKLLGIDERQFMAATQATFKLGIQFEHWRKQQHQYLHAFGQTGQSSFACDFQHFWLRGRQLGIAADFGDYCLESVAARAGKFAHLPDNGLNYAYHLDASRYALFLRNLAEQAGITRIDGTISAIATDANNGFIDTITLADGQRISGDLFIDCTGFRALLIEQTLRVGFEDWSHWLLCDRAVAMQSERIGELVPFTRSIAHPAGWQWRIPLRERMGNGLIYSSQYMSDDAASTTLTGSVSGKALHDPRFIRFTPGRRRKQWHKNCVALGLASGFLEPLESTSIHLIQQGIIKLIRLFPHKQILPSAVDEYNQQCTAELGHIRDFLILHYCVTQRNDSAFWRHCQSMPIPDSLQQKLDLFKQTGSVFHSGKALFEDSWQQVMLGQGLTPERYHPFADTMEQAELADFLSHVSGTIQRTVATMPDHERYIATMQ
mgnify:FL=1